MFIGHYGLGFSAKAADPRPSLGTCFLAAQWLDLLWPVLVLTGVEKLAIDPGNTRMAPLNFLHYPWSHSLLMSLVWAAVFGLVYFWRKGNARGAWILGLLVLSHWILDWITHRPDLPLTPFTDIKTGLGLWNHPLLEVPLETAIFSLGFLIYLLNTRSINNTGRWSLWAFAVFVLLIHLLNSMGDPPPNTRIVAWMGLSQWLLVAWGYWIDRNRK